MAWVWEPFFSAIAQVAVTAFAVLLATLQLRATTWKHSTLKRATAVLVLIDLFIPLVASIVALMPGNPWRVGYLVMGAVGICGLVWHVRTYLKHEDEADLFDDRQIQWGLPVSTVVYISLLAFSSAPATWSLHVVAGLSVWLIFSGSGGAWLLLTIGADELRGNRSAPTHGTVADQPAPQPVAPPEEDYLRVGHPEQFP
jgi:hypothetical protein